MRAQGRKEIAFAESAAVATPLVCGCRRPLIVMPRGAAEWSEDRRRVAILHELAHVKRRDCLTQALAQMACAAYWFNPLMWFAAHRLRQEREQACDDFVLAAGTKSSAYAAHLLEIARAIGTARPVPFARGGLAMAHCSQLEGRLMAILDSSTHRSSARRTRLAAAAALLSIAVPVAAVQLDTTVDVARLDTATAAIPDIRLPPVPANVAPSAPAPPREGAGMRDASVVPRGGGITRAVARPAADAAVQNPDLSRALVEASQAGALDRVAALIAAGAAVNGTVEGDGTPLIAAARSGRLEVVRLLLDRGADPNMAVPGDGNPLIAAALHGHVPVVELLLARGAAIDAVVPGDESALIQASGAGRLDTVKLLVARGADVNAGVQVTSVVQRSVIVADNLGRRRVVPSRQLESQWRSPLSTARRGGHETVIEYLISVGAKE